MIDEVVGILHQRVPQFGGVGTYKLFFEYRFSGLRAVPVKPVKPIEALAFPEKREAKENLKPAVSSYEVKWVELWFDYYRRLSPLFPNLRKFRSFAGSFGYRLGDIEDLIRHREIMLEEKKEQGKVLPEMVLEDDKEEKGKFDTLEILEKRE